MVAFERNREAGPGSIVAALDEGEGQLSLDDAFLDAAQQLGLEINLHQHTWRAGHQRLGGDKELNREGNISKSF